MKIIIEPYLDRSKLVANTTRTVITNLSEGALIVIFILVLLLGNLRAGLIVASVIPLSMLFAIGMMRVFGVVVSAVRFERTNFCRRSRPLGSMDLKSFRGRMIRGLSSRESNSEASRCEPGKGKMGLVLIVATRRSIAVPGKPSSMTMTRLYFADNAWPSVRRHFKCCRSNLTLIRSSRLAGPTGSP